MISRGTSEPPSCQAQRQQPETPRRGAGQSSQVNQQVGEELVCKLQPRQPLYQSLTKAILSN